MNEAELYAKSAVCRDMSSQEIDWWNKARTLCTVEELDISKRKAGYDKMKEYRSECRVHRKERTVNERYVVIQNMPTKQNVFLPIGTVVTVTCFLDCEALFFVGYFHYKTSAETFYARTAKVIDEPSVWSTDQICLAWRKNVILRDIVDGVERRISEFHTKGQGKGSRHAVYGVGGYVFDFIGRQYEWLDGHTWRPCNSANCLQV